MNRLYLFILIILFFINSIYATIYTCDPTISCGCSLSSTVLTSRIIGGETAIDHTWNWMVSFQDLLGHKCGATLISAEYALTAAHCISLSTPITELSIVIGTNNLTNLTNSLIQRREIIKYYIHPNFSYDDYMNDIAILYFSSLSLSTNSTFSIICLPTFNEDPFIIGSNLVVTGWGSIEKQGTDPYPYLQQVSIQVFAPTSSECISSNIKNSTTQICAGDSKGNKDSCHGDSGGPLMFFANNRWILVGITSIGRIRCAEIGYAGIYTRVAAYISFIQNITNFSGIIAPTTTAQTTLSALPNTTNGANNQKYFLYESILFLIFWSLVIIN